MLAVARENLWNLAEVEPGAEGIHGSGNKILLIFMAFISGAAVMIIELAANRILVPWFGNTLFTWTGLIGVILIALSLGYYAGGVLADLRCRLCNSLISPGPSSRKHLPHPALPPPGGGVFPGGRPMLGPILASSLLFAVPGVLLGALSPYIIRLVSLAFR